MKSLVEPLCYVALFWVLVLANKVPHGLAIALGLLYVGLLIGTIRGIPAAWKALGTRERFFMALLIAMLDGAAVALPYLYWETS
jgi:hypothetical protein